MIRLCLKPDPFAAQFRKDVDDDVERWTKALELRGYEVSCDDVYRAWQRHSDGSCASWLVSYRDDDLDCKALLAQLEPVAE